MPSLWDKLAAFFRSCPALYSWLGQKASRQEKDEVFDLIDDCARRSHHWAIREAGRVYGFNDDRVDADKARAYILRFFDHVKLLMEKAAGGTECEHCHGSGFVLCQRVNGRAYLYCCCLRGRYLREELPVLNRTFKPELDQRITEDEKEANRPPCPERSALPPLPL